MNQTTTTMPDSTTPPADPAAATPAARENATALDLGLLNTRRSSTQHAADAVWPHSQEANRPIRKTFGLPLTRAMGM